MDPTDTAARQASQESARHTAWHQRRLEALQAPDGWLTLIDLVWLDDGRHTIGSAADAAIRLPERHDAPTHWGILEVAGNVAHWTPAGAPARPLRSDRDGAAEIVRHGGLSFFLIERDQRLALRVRDEQAATRTGFRGIEIHPFAAHWQLSADWDGDGARFAHEGGTYRLRPQDPSASMLQFVIADRSSGHDTYGGGRFLFVPAPEGRSLVLDFNRAINPPCAFTPFAVCPLPPAENRLPFAIEAGEKTYR